MRDYPALHPVRTPKPRQEEYVRRYETESREAVATGGGVASIDFGSPPSGFMWLIRRIVVASTSVAASDCQVYVGRDVIAKNVVDATANGNRDIADEFSSIPVRPSQNLQVIFTGATAASVATVNITRDVVRV